MAGYMGYIPFRGEPLYIPFEGRPAYEPFEPPVTPRGWGRYVWGTTGLGAAVTWAVTYFQRPGRMKVCVDELCGVFGDDGGGSFDGIDGPSAYAAPVGDGAPGAMVGLLTLLGGLVPRTSYQAESMRGFLQRYNERTAQERAKMEMREIAQNARDAALDMDAHDGDGFGWAFGETPGQVGATRILGGKDIFDTPQWQPTRKTQPKTPWVRTRSGPTARLGGMNIFDSDAPLDGADTVTTEIQDYDTPGVAGRRGTEMRGRSALWPHRRFSVSDEQRQWWYNQPDTATAAPQSTPTVRAQARRDTGGYTTVDEHGYRPMEGTQGVVADLAQGLNWTAASPRDVFASIADKKRPCEKSRHDWNRESVRFPLETARYARENDNMGVRNFQYGDPPGPPGPPSVLGDLPCIGAAAVAAAAVI